MKYPKKVVEDKFKSGNFDYGISESTLDKKIEAAEKALESGDLEKASDYYQKILELPYFSVPDENNTGIFNLDRIDNWDYFLKNRLLNGFYFHKSDYRDKINADCYFKLAQISLENRDVNSTIDHVTKFLDFIEGHFKLGGYDICSFLDPSIEKNLNVINGGLYKKFRESFKNLTNNSVFTTEDILPGLYSPVNALIYQEVGKAEELNELKKKFSDLQEEYSLSKKELYSEFITPFREECDKILNSNPDIEGIIKAIAIEPTYLKPYLKLLEMYSLENDKNKFNELFENFKELLSKKVAIGSFDTFSSDRDTVLFLEDYVHKVSSKIEAVIQHKIINFLKDNFKNKEFEYASFGYGNFKDVKNEPLYKGGFKMPGPENFYLLTNTLGGETFKKLLKKEPILSNKPDIDTLLKKAVSLIAEIQNTYELNKGKLDFEIPDYSYKYMAESKIFERFLNTRINSKKNFWEEIGKNFKINVSGKNISFNKRRDNQEILTNFTDSLNLWGNESYFRDFIQELKLEDRMFLKEYLDSLKEGLTKDILIHPQPEEEFLEKTRFLIDYLGSCERTISHGDLHLENLLYDSRKDKVHIIDFARSTLASKFFDLAYLLEQPELELDWAGKQKFIDLFAMKKGLNQEDKNQYYLEYNYGALFVNLRIAGTFTKRQGNHDKVFLNQAKWVIDNMLDGPYVWDRNNLNILKDYINKAN